MVRLTKAGHRPAEATVTLARGETQPVALTLAAEQGEVQIASEPPDADLLVDGQPRGKAGQTLSLTAVPHEIELRRAGFEPHRVTVTPRPGFPQLVRARLQSHAERQAAATPAVVRPPAGHEMRLLRGGRFQMGASRREPGRRANETLREVELQRPFYIAAREVTNAQFRKWKSDHSSGRFGAHDLSVDVHPVVNVTWEQAAEYCNWLSSQEGLPAAYAMRDGKLAPVAPLNTGYRLPTEAEWSRAARYPGGGAAALSLGQCPPRAPARRELRGRVGAVPRGRGPPGLRRPLPRHRARGKLPAERPRPFRPRRQRRRVGERRLRHPSARCARRAGPHRATATATCT